MKREITIAIVDDSLVAQKIAKEKLAPVLALETFGNINFLPLTCYDSGKALIDAEDEPDLILMDYGMPEMNGLETAIQLSKRGVKSKVLFLTGHDDLMEPLLYGYSVDLVRDFILKSESENAFQQTVIRVLKEILDVHLITIRHYEEIKNRDSGQYNKVFSETIIDAKKIVTIESKRKEVFIYMEDGEEYLTNKPLKDWLVILPEGDFSQCNRHVLINLKYVYSVGMKMVALTLDEDAVQLGEKYKNHFEKAYWAYKIRETMK